MYSKEPFERVFDPRGSYCALAGHVILNKTINILKEHFYWPKMGRDLYKVVTTCSIYHKSKNQFHQSLYTPLLVHLRPWDNISIDFIMAIPGTQMGKDAIMVVVDRFVKMAHFIPCHEIDDASHIA